MRVLGGTIFIDALQRVMSRYDLAPMEIRYRSIRIDARKIVEVKNTCKVKSELTKAIIEVDYAPTYFRFAGNQVLYPSPLRLLYSLVRTFYTMTGVDVRQRISHLHNMIELIDFNGRLLDATIGRGENSGARRIKAFYGRAKYAFYGNRRDYECLIELLKIARFYGIGANKSLGFGTITRLHAIEATA